MAGRRPRRRVRPLAERRLTTAGSVEAGIAPAKELAGDGLVCVAATDVAPVVMGEGVRFFGRHTGTVLLDDPDQVVQGDRVLHLHYTVRRAGT